jgi:phenylacetate-CoA ligase
MIAPGPEGKGGMSSVVKVYEQSQLFADGRVVMISSFMHGSPLTKLKDAAWAFFKYGWLLLRGESSVLHIHVASRASFWRKSMFIWLAWFANRRIIFHLHGGAFNSFIENLSPFSRRYAIATMNRCDQILCLTSTIESWLASLVPSVPVQWWPNPVPDDLFEKNPPTELREPVVFYLGALLQAKGLSELLTAFAALHVTDPSARLILAGSGPEQENLQKAVRDLGLRDNVEFLGWIGSEQKNSWLKRARVLVLASHSEAQPMAVLEAMASGVAVIGTNVGGVPDLIQDGVHGLLVPPRDVAALTLALTTLWQDTSMRQRLVQAAFERTAQYHKAENVCGALRTLYGVVGTRGASVRTGLALRYRFIDVVRGSDSVRLLDKLKKWQYQRPEQIQQYARSELAKYITELRTSVPLFKNVTQYADLPVLDKHFIKIHYHELMNPLYQGKLIRKKTGGSTGEPLVYFTGTDSLSYLWAGIFLSWQVAGYQFGDRVAFLAGSALLASGYKQVVYYRLMNVTLMSSFTMSDDSMREYGNRLQEEGFRLLYGYSAAIHRLARFYLDAGQTLPSQLRGIVCTAETLTPLMREDIEAAFGVPCYSQYGCHDAGVSAFECEERNGFHLISTRCYHEVMENGELVATDLSNRAMFMPRCNTGDVVRISNRPCPCGRGFPLIDEVVGRQNDIVTDSKGNAAHSEYFTHIFREDERIFSFQVLFDVNWIEVNIHIRPVGDQELSILDERVRGKVKAVLDFQEVRVKFNQPFKALANGKHRFVMKEGS